MAIISRPGKSDPGGSSNFASGATILASEVNADISTLYGLVNGNINNANIIEGAGITYSRLALGGNVKNADVSATADIVGTKLAINTIPGDRLLINDVPTAALENDAVTIAKVAGGTTSTLPLVTTVRDLVYKEHTWTATQLFRGVKEVWTVVTDMQTTGWTVHGNATLGSTVMCGICPRIQLTKQGAIFFDVFFRLVLSSVLTTQTLNGPVRRVSNAWNDPVGSKHPHDLFGGSIVDTMDFGFDMSGIFTGVKPAADWVVDLEIGIWADTGTTNPWIDVDINPATANDDGNPDNTVADEIAGSGNGRPFLSYTYLYTLAVG